jgi:hypothetical protein
MQWRDTQQRWLPLVITCSCKLAPILDGIDATDVSIANVSATKPQTLDVNLTSHAALAPALDR